MEDQQIFRVALAVAMVGIVGMIVFANDISPREIKIKEMTHSMADEEVILDCFVEQVKKASGSDTYFLRVNDGTAKTTIVLFEGTAHEIEKGGLNLKLLNNRRIRATGTVTNYKGAMELVLKDQNSLKLI
ncbi:DNA-binding protein [Methanobacterium alcaliphilum]|uniref:DNA-binding protein n=1 Tax=Methanobacterium alcaliphilum TaxID=392018 RepID=UPI00200AE0D3|nr:DNA-binding protein [Methanobacterium alcaliphilum]MCK9151927.1 DNA-binding protein [Methanobacterium alcaliphilum]